MIITFSVGSFIQAQNQVEEKLISDKLLFPENDNSDWLVFDLLLANLPETGSVPRILDNHRHVLFEERTDAKTYQRGYKIAVRCASSVLKCPTDRPF